MRKKKAVIAEEPISAKGAAAQIPSACQRRGRVKTKRSSKPKVLTNEMIAETRPLLKAVK